MLCKLQKNHFIFDRKGKKEGTTENNEGTKEEEINEEKKEVKEERKVRGSHVGILWRQQYLSRSMYRAVVIVISAIGKTT